MESVELRVGMRLLAWILTVTSLLKWPPQSFTLRIQ